MLHVSSHDLAVALARRLDEVAPAGVAVRVQASDLVVLHAGRVLGISGAPAILETVEALHEPAENLETAVRATLSAVQDYIAEATTEPWPGTGGRQPNPDARVEASTVSMWFGPEDAPVLRLPPIDLTAPA
jgi:hypothetical protein